MLESYVNELSSRLGVETMQHKVSFCVRQDINVTDIIHSLKVSSKQSSHKLTKTLGNITYFSSCYSFFSFQDEREIDNTVRHNLKEFINQFENRKFINSNMLDNLNQTLHLSLYAYSQKVRRTFFKYPENGASSLRI